MKVRLLRAPRPGSAACQQSAVAQPVPGPLGTTLGTAGVSGPNVQPG